jgi:nuclear mRNA export protein PCID2/THP1
MKWIDVQFNGNNSNYSEDMFPMSWRIQLAYLKGRIFMFTNEQAKAREQLRFAFEKCHTENPRNKKKILKFLVLVEINLNNFPSKALL